jgi:protein phosphatase
VSAAITSAGKVRRVNEDSVIERYPAFVVADGMGGHDAGDVASGIVTEELAALELTGQGDVAAVKRRLAAAAHRIERLGSPGHKQAAGTTVSGVVVVMQNGEPYWLVVNLGDSRTYRMARGALEQLSVDHSEVQELVDLGRLSPAAARHHPRRNVVTRALGAGADGVPDYWLLPIEQGDRILVCSDGLTSEVSDTRIAAALAAHADPQRAAGTLMAAALAAGGRDNISVIVVDALVAPTSGEADTVESAQDLAPATRPNPAAKGHRP